MSRDRSVYLYEIMDRIRRIELYTKGGREAFFSNEIIQDAVVRNLEVIGQAVKDFGVEQLTAGHSDIPWNHIAGMRNILAHQYLGVDLTLTWDVVARDITLLKSKIIAIAAEIGITFQVE
jgi:uncharacterized protein with HEPN domain